METLEYDHNEIANRTKSDDKLFVTFYIDAVEDEEASKKEGMRKFRDAEFIRIIVPGDKKNIVIREVRDDDKQRFEARYAAFKRNEEEVLTGYPLKQWPGIGKAMFEELKYMGFRTVEDVANMSDGTAGKVAGWHILKRRAQTFLEVQAGNAPAEKLQAALGERDATIAAQGSMIAELNNKLNRLLAALPEQKLQEIAAEA